MRTISKGESLAIAEIEITVHYVVWLSEHMTVHMYDVHNIIVLCTKFIIKDKH